MECLETKDLHETKVRIGCRIPVRRLIGSARLELKPPLVIYEMAVQ
jgi:hypothetical protein